MQNKIRFCSMLKIGLVGISFIGSILEISTKRYQLAYKPTVKYYHS